MAVNLAAGGRLDEILAAARADGLTHDRIATLVRDETGVEVSREWVRTQLQRIEQSGSAA